MRHLVRSRRGLFFACLLAFESVARAVTPAPDGGYPIQNTAEGDSALFSLTSGINDTATGYHALYYNTTGHENTATGSVALNKNTTGIENTAFGIQALGFNTTASYNTAVGGYALVTNVSGGHNTAIGSDVMFNNISGSNNTAAGFQALYSGGDDNTALGYDSLYYNTGDRNTSIGYQALLNHTLNNGSTAVGYQALYGSYPDTGTNNTASGLASLYSNNLGNNNVANGANALTSNTSGNSNSAIGFNALRNNTTGSTNIAIGASAGSNLTTGSNNIDIGGLGAAGESNTIRLGKLGVQSAAYIIGIRGATVAGGVTVMVDNMGHLGTICSSARFKDEIKPMDKASEALLSLQPVTFRYKHELDPEAIPQFGLVAEQVEKIDPDLVAQDEQGKVYTVRYEAVNAMLLNEFLKEHRKVEKQATTISELKSTAAAQQQAINTLTTSVQKQAAQIEKVSAQVSLARSAAEHLVSFHQ